MTTDIKALAERLEHEAMTLDAECRIMAKHSTSTNTPTRRAALYREAAAALREPSTPSAQAGEVVACVVNGYLPRERAVEVRLDDDVPAWITQQPGVRAYLSATPQPQGDATDLAIARATIDCLRTRLAACEGALEKYHARELATPQARQVIELTPSAQVSGGGEVSDEDVEAFCRDYWKGEWPGRGGDPDTDNELRATIRSGLEAVERNRRLSTPQARPDGGEAVAEVADLCGLRVPSWIGAGASPSLPVGTKLYTHPTPAPDAVARLVEDMASRIRGLIAETDPDKKPATGEKKLIADELRAILALTAAQQEGSSHE